MASAESNPPEYKAIALVFISLIFGPIEAVQTCRIWNTGSSDYTQTKNKTGRFADAPFSTFCPLNLA
jgi:hypothetical protein